MSANFFFNLMTMYAHVKQIRIEKLIYMKENRVLNNY